MAAEDETDCTLSDEDIIHALAKELARDDRRDTYANEEELDRCAKWSLYETPARQFLLMYRKLWELGQTGITSR